MANRRAASELERLLASRSAFDVAGVQIIFTPCWGSLQRQLGMLVGVMERFDHAEEPFQAALPTAQGAAPPAYR